MKIPVITGLIQRRILVNYRVHPDTVKPLLPAGFSPQIVNGYAIAGVCLIRLEQIRPKGLPKFLGLSSENSAHRIAVQWSYDGSEKQGVFVPRRDTGSRLNALAGGRVFPGVHHLSQFHVNDCGDEISLKVEAQQATNPLVEIEAYATEKFPNNSVFRTLEASSDFFEAGCIGYSARPNSTILDGLKLELNDWKVSPLECHLIRSSYFDDTSIFPEGTIEFDHALLMRNCQHEWHSEDQIRP